MTSHFAPEVANSPN